MRKLKLEELGRLSIEAFKNSPKIPVVVVLDNVRSMHNVGAVFRTSDAFAVEQVYLCGITAQPPHKEIRKTAIGATESVDWMYVSSAKACVEKLLEEGYEVLAIEQTKDSTPLEKFRFDANKKYGLVLGNEVEGVSDEVLDLGISAIEIPQRGTKHSLNVSVCTGVVLWEAFKVYS